MYGEELNVTTALDGTTMLRLRLRPTRQSFMECVLQLSLHAGYPHDQQPPGIKLQATGGFSGREPELLDELQQQANDMAGEMVAGLLIHAAQSWLEEHNHPLGEQRVCCVCHRLTLLAQTRDKRRFCWCWASPDQLEPACSPTASSTCGAGPCIFCLEDLTAAGQRHDQQLLRLPCFHAFHM